MVLGATASTMCVDMKYQMYVGVQDKNTEGEVSELQYYLKQKGYFEHKVTGIFGELTKESVKEYQKDHYLIVTGIVGRITRRTMNEEGCIK
jgi:peptidoglycan hydrolase-like protein with peptidoglycan-binding domain